MQSRGIAVLALAALVSAGCGGGSDPDVAVAVADAPTNDDGSPVTDIFTARFDPSNAVLPFPNNLLFGGTTDLTINIPVADPTDTANPQVAINALDGFSTTSATTTTFDAPIAPASVVPGTTVRLFKVNRTASGGVNGVIEELVGGQDFTAVVAGSDPTGQTLAVLPLTPLDQISTYMVVVTRGVAKTNGTNATPDQTYFLGQRRSPLASFDQNGQCTGSLDPLLPASTSCALEPLRQLINSQELSAAAFGVNTDDIVVSWSFTTQSTTVVSGVAASIAQPRPSILAPTGLSTAAVGLGGLSDLYFGAIELPYYLEAPTAENPLGPIQGFWEAAPGNYTPDFAPLGLDPTSTNLTFANPIPVQKSAEWAPLLATVPNESAGVTKPPAGWPVVIYSHGITRNRTDMLALADTLALQGFAVIAMDQPLHGITDRTSPFYAGNLPAGLPPVRERTFDVDYTPENDSDIDPSGTYFINLQSLLTTRDNNRQAQIDLVNLARTVPTMDLNFDGTPDIDGSRVHFIGQSLGSISGIPFLALEPSVTVGGLSVPGATLAPMLIGSPTFAPQINAGLAAAGIETGSPDYFQFIAAAQTVTDSGDPINYAAATAAGNAVLVHEVVGGPDSLPDQVIPNTSPFSPLAGTEPLIRVMGLPGISASTSDPNGVRAAVRFTAGGHGSLLSPADSFATTVEMQSQFVSLMASDGQQVLVSDASVILSQ